MKKTTKTLIIAIVSVLLLVGAFLAFHTVSKSGDVTTIKKKNATAKQSIAEIEDILGKPNRINTLISKKLKEVADKYGYEYTTDHGGHYIGKNDRWDEKAGVYHD